MEKEISYPRWKYHAKKEAVMVKNAEQEKALGKGWHDAPVEKKEEKIEKEDKD